MGERGRSAHRRAALMTAVSRRPPVRAVYYVGVRRPVAIGAGMAFVATPATPDVAQLKNSSCKCAVFARYVHGDFLWDEIVDLAWCGFRFCAASVRVCRQFSPEFVALRFDAA